MNEHEYEEFANDEVRLESLRERVARLPQSPGVYLMKDKEGVVIYVGKAKSLRARVRTYFNGGDGRYQIDFLVKRVFSFETILTDSDDQAYILERQLIAKYKPRYNIRLKDDKSYLSIRIDPSEEWPRLRMVRRIEHDGAEYFGPYTFAHEARALTEVIDKMLPLRTCNDTVFHNRQRPCLEYQIKRCAGPCVLPVDRDEYREWVEQAMAILRGDVAGLTAQLTEKMEQAAEQLNFERAATLRDRIDLLENFQKGQRLVSRGLEDRDVFCLHREERLAALCVLHVRNGRISDSSLFSFSEVEVSDGDVLQSAVEQFYDSGREVPPEIILSSALSDEDLVKTRLKVICGHVVTFTVPKQGLKFRTLQLAELNAQQHYRSTFDSESRWMETARTISGLLRLSQLPRRIECVDISNLQGSDIVGAVVSFFDGKPRKQDYKKYKITQQGKPDDFASIFEVVSRRLERGFREDSLPDLLIIDGGKGQLSAACEARDQLGIDLDIVSLAKIKPRKGLPGGKTSERIFLEGESEAIPLAEGEQLFRFFTQIRDEVHRFVITFHRGVRSRRVMTSALDAVPGIGVERKRKLLREFGSVENLCRYSVEEISSRAKISLVLTERLLEHLKLDGSKE